MLDNLREKNIENSNISVGSPYNELKTDYAIIGTNHQVKNPQAIATLYHIPSVATMDQIISISKD
jgi:hypothetical protein